MDDAKKPLQSELCNWKLTLAYDGTNFHGWQIQPGQLTIQGELQAALRRVTGEAPLPQGSGRTDTGVHALEQVASFPLTVSIPPSNLVRALNHTLPASIKILEAKTVPITFHARHSARAKTYLYRVYQAGTSQASIGQTGICPPFLAPYVYACSWMLDFDKLQQTAQAFLGEHDFLSFAAADPDLATRNRQAEEARSSSPDELVQWTRSTIRTIFTSEWQQQTIPTESAIGQLLPVSGTLLVYRVQGNGFLHHMVRNMVGTMLDAARGHISPDSIPGILAAQVRAAAGRTAPARGLFLHSVKYDSEDSANLKKESQQSATGCKE